MNCQDIARILDEQEVDALLADERSAVHVHLATCRDCARDWQIHAQLADASIPTVPAELRALYSSQAGRGANFGSRQRTRLLIVSTLVAVAAAAAMLALKMNSLPPPVAATVAPVHVDPVQMEPSVIHGVNKLFLSPTEAMSEDVAKAVDEWTQRVVEWLTNRDDPDALIAAALLLRNDSGPVDVGRFQLLVQRAAATEPESPRIQAMAMFLCGAEKPCDATPYELALRRLVPENALGWVEEMNRASSIKDQDAFQGALAAMARARTFDLHQNESMAAMIMQVRAARVAPPETGASSLRVSTDRLAYAAFGEEFPSPNFEPMLEFCKSAADERTLLVCRQIGGAMRAGDTWEANVLGLTLSGSGLPADSAEALSLKQERNLVEWISVKSQEIFSDDDVHSEDERQDYLRLRAVHPRQIDALRAMLKERGIPTEPPADWKP